MATRSSVVKYWGKSKYRSKLLCRCAYPCLGTGTDTRIDQGGSAGGGIGLSIEAKVRSEELDALVVALLDDPLLTSRCLPVVSAITGRQSDRSASVGVGHLDDSDT